MAWYNSSWDYRKEITIDSTQVDATVSNFPVYIEITGDTDLASNAQSSGNDILFTESDGSTKLDHEIQGYDGTNGDLYAHVQISSLSSSSDTTIYMYYGNSGASDQQSVDATWGTDFVSVHHLNEAASGTGTADVYEDSSGSAHHGDDQVSATNKDGQVYQGQAFDYTDDYIPIPYNADFDLTTFSISIWFKTSVTSNNDIITLSSKEDPSGQYQNRNWWVAIDNGQGFSGTDGAVALRTSSGGSVVSISSNTDHRDGNWHHIFAIFDPPSDNAELWIDGTERASQSGVGNPDTQSADVLIGSENATSLPYREWSGNLDEHLIYNSAKSSGYITTLYNNQNSPGTFISVGTQEQESTVTTQTVSAISIADNAVENSSTFSRIALNLLSPVDSISNRGAFTESFEGAVGMKSSLSSLIFSLVLLVSTFGVSDKYSLAGVFAYIQSSVIGSKDNITKSVESSIESIQGVSIAGKSQSFVLVGPSPDFGITKQQISAISILDSLKNIEDLAGDVFVQTVSDVVAISEDLSRTVAFSRQLADVASVTSKHTKAPLLLSSEKLVVRENRISIVSRVVENSMGIISTLTFATVLLQSHIIDVIGKAEKNYNIIRVISGEVGIVESYAPAVNYSERLLERLSIVYSSLHSVSFSRHFEEERVLVEESVIAAGFLIIISEGVGMLESSIQNIRRFISQSQLEIVHITDQSNRIGTLTRSAEGVIAISMDLSQYALFGRVFVDTVSVIENHTKQISVPSVENIPILESRIFNVSRTVESFIGVVTVPTILISLLSTDVVGVRHISDVRANFFESLSNTFGIISTASLSALFSQTLQRTLGLIDTRNIKIDFIISIDEFVNIYGSSLQNLSRFVSESFTDIVSLEEEASRVGVLIRVVDGIISISDNVSTLSSFRRSFVELVDIDYTSTIAEFYERVFVEAFGGIESVQDVSVVKQISSRVAVYDSISSPKNIVRALLEAFGTIESAQDVRVVKLFSDSTAIESTRKVVVIRTLFEYVSIGDSLITFLSRFIVLSSTEIVTLVGRTSVSGAFTRAFSEALNIINKSEVSSSFVYVVESVIGFRNIPLKDISKQVSSTISLVASLQRSKISVREFIENVVLSDVLRIAIRKYLVGVVNVEDNISYILDGIRTLLETVGVKANILTASSIVVIPESVVGVIGSLDRVIDSRRVFSGDISVGEIEIHRVEKDIRNVISVSVTYSRTADLLRRFQEVLTPIDIRDVALREVEFIIGTAVVAPSDELQRRFDGVREFIVVESVSVSRIQKYIKYFTRTVSVQDISIFSPVSVREVVVNTSDVLKTRVSYIRTIDKYIVLISTPSVRSNIVRSIGSIISTEDVFDRTIDGTRGFVQTISVVDSSIFTISSVREKNIGILDDLDRVVDATRAFRIIVDIVSDVSVSLSRVENLVGKEVITPINEEDNVLDIIRIFEERLSTFDITNFGPDIIIVEVSGGLEALGEFVTSKVSTVVISPKDNYSLGIVKQTFEVVDFEEDINFATEIALVDTITVVDVTVNNISKILSTTIVSISEKAINSGIVVVDVISIEHRFSRVADLTRIQSEIVNTVGELNSALREVDFAALTEVVSTGDELGRVYTGTRTFVSNSGVVIRDSVTFIISFIEDIGAIIDYSRLFTGVRAFYSNAGILIEYVSSASYHRLVTENVIVVSVYSRVLDMQREFIEDVRVVLSTRASGTFSIAVTLVEDINILSDRIRFVSGVRVAEDIIAIESKSIYGVVVRNVESINVIEGFSPVISYIRDVDNIFGIGDTLGTSASIIFIVEETISVVYEETGVVVKSIEENVEFVYNGIAGTIGGVRISVVVGVEERLAVITLYELIIVQTAVVVDNLSLAPSALRIENISAVIVDFNYIFDLHGRASYIGGNSVRMLRENNVVEIIDGHKRYADIIGDHTFVKIIDGYKRYAEVINDLRDSDDN